MKEETTVNARVPRCASATHNCDVDAARKIYLIGNTTRAMRIPSEEFLVFSPKEVSEPKESVMMMVRLLFLSSLLCLLTIQKSISVPIVELIIVRTDDGSNPAGRALSENGTSGNLSAITILFPRQFELEDEDFTDEILDRRKNIVNIGEILAGAFTLNPLKIIRGALGWAPDGIREGIYNGILGIANPATTAKPKVANATALNVTLSGNATVPTTLLPSTTLESTTENNDPEDENEEGEESSA